MNEKVKGVQIIEDSTGKTALLDFSLSKKTILWLIVIVLSVLTVTMLFSTTISVNHESVQMGMLARIGIVSLFWIGLMAMYFFMYYPLSMAITRKVGGSFIVKKRDWFFSEKIYTLNVQQEPRIIGRRRKMVGATIYIGPPAYQLIIRYKVNGIEQDISSIFTAAYFMRGLGPRGVFAKAQLEEISAQIGLPLTIEE